MALRKGTGPAKRDDASGARKGAIKKRNPSSLQNKSSQALTSTEWKPWAEKICTAWQNATESIIATGMLLIDAKEELAHGSFESMVQLKLPFSPRAARMLMKIATHPVISNRKHVSVLPPSWGTLYQLALLPARLCEQCIEDKSIHPKMERKDATALVKKPPTTKKATLGGVSGRGHVKKPISIVPNGSQPEPIRDDVAADEELSILREFARFVIEERVYDFKYKPEDRDEWRGLLGRVKAILRNGGVS